jgi:hypothetical protein
VVEGQFAAAGDQQAVAVVVGADPGAVIPARALGAGDGADAVPAAGRQGGGDVIGAQPTCSCGFGYDSISSRITWLYSDSSFIQLPREVKETTRVTK